MSLSRRDFLRVWATGLLAGRMGVTFAGAALPPLAIDSGARQLRFAGRALEMSTVHAFPHPDAPPVRTVHPEAVLSLMEAEDGWFRVVDGGYVRARQVQPMIPYTPPPVYARVDAPFWAEVVAPVTVARRWPLPDAPALGRLGYGATARAVDAQRDDWGHLWYRDEAGGGWVQALHVRRLDEKDLTPINPGAAGKRLLVTVADEATPARAHLSAWEGDVCVFDAPICAGRAFLEEVGRAFTVECRQPALKVGARLATCRVAEQCVYLGAPWAVRAGALTLHGAYWHNDFGSLRADIEGRGIALAPPAARWIYRWVEPGTTPVQLLQGES